MHFTVGKIAVPSVGQFSYPRYIGLTSPTKRDIITRGVHGLTKSTVNDRSRNDLTTLKATEEEIRKALNKLNEMVKSQKRELNFFYDERIDKIVVSVIEGNTGKVVRQIPSEELIRLSLKMDKIMGLLINHNG